MEKAIRGIGLPTLIMLFSPHAIGIIEQYFKQRSMP
jgi:hypothetical protein